MTHDLPALLFVYNADTGLAAAAGDFAARFLAPEKYSCNLCMVTYGPFAMKSPWKEFVETIPNETEFLHRDEFRKAYPAYADEPLPAVFARGRDGRFTSLVPARDINAVSDWQGLKEILLAALEKHGAL